jgi:hypothetical protein
LTAEQQDYLTQTRQQIELEEQLIKNDMTDRNLSIFRSQRANQIKIEMERLRGELGRTAAMFDDVYAGSLSTFFETVIKDVDSVGDAFKQLGTDIFDQINRIVSQDIANSIIGSVGLGDLTASIFGPNRGGGTVPGPSTAAGTTVNTSMLQTGAGAVASKGMIMAGVDTSACNPCATFGSGGEFSTVLTDGAMVMGDRIDESGTTFTDKLGNTFSTFSDTFSNLMTNLFSTNASGGTGGGGFDLFGAIGGLFGGGGSSDLNTINEFPPALSSFAKGGSFRVGGSGGIDSQVVTITRPDQDNRINGFSKGGGISFRASPNERVTFHKMPRFAQGGAVLPEELFSPPTFSGKEPDSMDKVKQDSKQLTVNNTFHITSPGGNVSESTQRQIAGRMMSSISMAQRRTQ